MEKEKARAKKQAAEEQKQAQMQLMADGVEEDEQEEEEPSGLMMNQQNNMQNFDNDGQEGALVADMRRQMEEEQADFRPQAEPDEDAGPKIKMGRIGKKKKRRGGAAGAAAAEAERPQAAGGLDMPGRKAGGGAGFAGGQGFTEQDVEFMKKAIQVLCQSTNPLGKSIDFVTDDVDSMSKEYERWRKESIACQSQLEDQ